MRCEVRSTPENADFEAVGGAFVNCYVCADAAETAAHRATSGLAQERWEALGVEEGPSLMSRRSLDSDSEALEAYDTAITDGECYIYRAWANEAQDEDPIHQD